MRVEICGKRWNLKLVHKTKRRRHHGKCDDPTDVGKEIQVEHNDEEQRVLDTILHECLHAGVWSLDEKVVAQWAGDVAKILIKLGWHR